MGSPQTGAPNRSGVVKIGGIVRAKLYMLARYMLSSCVHYCRSNISQGSAATRARWTHDDRIYRASTASRGKYVAVTECAPRADKGVCVRYSTSTFKLI